MKIERVCRGGCGEIYVGKNFKKKCKVIIIYAIVYVYNYDN